MGESCVTLSPRHRGIGDRRRLTIIGTLKEESAPAKDLADRQDEERGGEVGGLMGEADFVLVQDC